GGFVRPIFGAGEESHEIAALLRIVVANRSTQRGVAGLQRVENRTLGDGSFDFQRHFAADLRQSSETRGKNYSNHGSVCTSTESTPGRSRTMGAQVSPASADT